jgi:hypothetical protein
MRLLLILVVSVLLTNCSVKDCKWQPNVQIKIENKDNKEGTEQKSKSAIDTVKDLKEGVEPGARMVCNY